MREILFRGKRIDNGEWVEGYIFDDGMIDSRRKFVGEIVIEDYKGSADDLYCITGSCFYEVRPETVCQYTGLTDNMKWEELSENEKQKFLSEWNQKEGRQNTKEDWNGRKIFEGDIVETVFDGKQNPNYVVVWDADELDFKATNGKEHCKRNFEYLGCCDEIIVIGNIFDNSELLKEEPT